jgi:hypothetical protein
MHKEVALTVEEEARVVKAVVAVVMEEVAAVVVMIMAEVTAAVAVIKRRQWRWYRRR